LPELKRNVLSLIHIIKKGHSIHVFDGIIEIRRASDNMVFMNGVEDDNILKLNGTTSNSQNSTNLAQHSGTLSSSLL